MGRPLNEESEMWVELDSDKDGRIKITIYQRDTTSGRSEEVASIFLSVAQADNFVGLLATEIDAARKIVHVVREEELKKARADLTSAQERVDELSKVVESLESAGSKEPR